MISNTITNLIINKNKNKMKKRDIKFIKENKVFINPSLIKFVSEEYLIKLYYSNKCYYLNKCNVLN